jgi:hypothetical protein
VAEIITREKYMKGEASHEAYYAQFRTPAVERAARAVLRGIQTVPPRGGNYAHSPLVIWDLHANEIRADIAATNNRIGNGSVFSLCEGVCALKACASALEREDKEKQG